MEEHFLDSLVKEMREDSSNVPEGGLGKPWYNRAGDCLVFQTVDEAYVGDRIDDVLTIYRSISDNRPIGFQLKDVKTIIDEYGYEGLRVETTVQGDRLVSVYALLLAAYELSPQNIARRLAYSHTFSLLARPSPKTNSDESDYPSRQLAENLALTL
ncbi:MAG: hypothetical protein HY706_04865 [Candidatus Hydrogenedentes bacterium]|nr:hypothetical protein [Candidatus Hydrogenedentota bacterium]